MVRFKVVRASRLLLTVSILLLVAMLAILALRLADRGSADPVGGSANLVDAAYEDEAKTHMVFASSDRGDSLFSPTSAGIEIEILEASPAPTAARRVLIYHTHTHEAYEQVSDDPYEALEAWRTTDADHSVVRVGEELARSLRDSGLEVVHDTTDHEGEQLSTAYARSILTLEKYDEPFDLYIDLHRDAYLEGEPLSVTRADGAASAQLMALIGNGNGFEEKPFYAQNLAFANALKARIDEIEPGLCKPVLIKDGRYNQHIGVFAILVEVGHNRNTLRQALNAVPPLAKAICSLMLERPDPLLERMKSEYDAGSAPHAAESASEESASGESASADA